MAKAGELRFVVTTDASGAITDMKKITGGVDELDKNTKKASGSWGKLGRRIAAAISIYAGSRLFQSIGKAAIDAAETTSKFGVVFRDELSRANEITRELTTSYGFSVTGAEAALSSVGDLAQGLGIASGESLRMAEATAKFATDLVSFTNVAGGTERAIDALTKAQLGEREMLKAYGIAIMEADVQQRLMLKGQKDLEGAALKAAKAQVVLELAMEQSKNAMGDFARTADSPANQLRVLESRVEDFKVGLGKSIIEQQGFKDTLSAINDTLSDPNLKDGLAAIISGIAKLASTLITATAGLIDFITQTSKLKLFEKAAEQTESLTMHMRRQEQAISDAGISIDRYHEALRQTPQFKEILDLTGAIEEQKKKIEETKEATKSSIFDPTRSSIIAKEQGKLSELIRNQTELQVKANMEIMKNARAYGITTQETEKYKKSLQGRLKETEKQIEAEKEVENQSKKTTKAIETQTEMILRLGKEQEAAYDKTIDLGAAFSDLTEEVEKQKEKVEPVIEGWETIEETYEKSVTAGGKLKESTDRINNELIEQKNAIIDAIGAFETLFDGMVDILGISDDMARKVKGITSTIGKFASGDYFGAIVSGAGLVVDMFSGSDGIQDSVQAATVLLEEFGITGSDAVQQFADQLAELDFDISDLMDFENVQNELNQMAEDFAISTPEYWDKLFSETVKPLTEFLQTAATSQGEFNDQISVALDTFAAAINSGMGYAAALKAMEEPFGLLKDSMEEFGFTSTGVFSDLLSLQQKVADNEQLISSIDAFNSLLSASGDLIGGNQEKFDSYVNLAVGNYDKLIEKEFTQQEALLLTAPALQQLQELQEKYGFTVDENTQKLIDEADSLGLFKTDPLDKIVEVLELIAIQLGATLPEAAESGADRTARAFKRVADEAIKDFERLGKAMPDSRLPGIDTGETRNPQPSLLPANTPGFANGGSGVVPPGFNNDDFFFRASSGETVNVTPASRNSAGGGPGVTNVNITNNVPQTFHQQANPKQVMDAVIDAGKESYRREEFRRVFR